MRQTKVAVWIAAGVVVVLLFLCLTGGAGAVFLLQGNGTKTSRPDPEPVAQSPQVRPSPSVQVPVRIALPLDLGGRKMSQTEATWDAEYDLERAVGSVNGIGETLTEAYGSEAGQDLVIFSAGMLKPSSYGKLAPTALFASMKVWLSVAPAKVMTADPGTLGGEAECAEVSLQNTPAAACAWTDEFTAGVVVFYGYSADKANLEFAALRARIEQRR